MVVLGGTTRIEKVLGMSPNRLTLRARGLKTQADGVWTGHFRKRSWDRLWEDWLLRYVMGLINQRFGNKFFLPDAKMIPGLVS